MRRKKKERQVRVEEVLPAPSAAIGSHGAVPWRVAAVAFAATRLPLVLFAWILHRFLGPASPPSEFLYHGGAPHASWLVDAFQKWDSYWFLNVVREGYHFYGAQEQVRGVVPGGAETNIVSFPLYPFAVKAASWLFGDPAVAGLIVSQIALFLALVWLYRLARLDLGEGGAAWAVWLFAVQPWTYAFSAIHAESLFFALTVAAVLAARQGRFLLAGMAGFLAALTRLPGVLVLVPVALEYSVSRPPGRFRVDRRFLALGLIPLGLVLYFGYLWRLTGHPFAYFTAQAGWHNRIAGPWVHVVRWLSPGGFNGQALFELGVIAFMIGALILGYRFVRRSYWIYLLVSVLVLVSSASPLGLARYCAGLFPVYLVLAGLAAKSSQAGRAMAAIFAMSAPVVYFIWAGWVFSF